tara:strand:- start:2194 stop:2556 length:363 start_codon:yes stop_codon:yes gene_type:complete
LDYDKVGGHTVIININAVVINKYKITPTKGVAKTPIKKYSNSKFLIGRDFLFIRTSNFLCKKNIIGKAAINIKSFNIMEIESGIYIATKNDNDQPSSKNSFSRLDELDRFPMLFLPNFWL